MYSQDVKVYFFVFSYFLCYQIVFPRGKYGYEALQIARLWEKEVVKLKKLKCDIMFSLHYKRTASINDSMCADC